MEKKKPPAVKDHLIGDSVVRCYYFSVSL